MNIYHKWKNEFAKKIEYFFVGRKKKLIRLQMRMDEVATELWCDDGSNQTGLIDRYNKYAADYNKTKYFWQTGKKLLTHWK